MPTFSTSNSVSIAALENDVPPSPNVAKPSDVVNEPPSPQHPATSSDIAANLNHVVRFMMCPFSIKMNAGQT
jgi:hypothetical protein